VKWSWKEWALICSTVIALALLGRLDLLVIVVPLAALVSYALSRMRAVRHSGQRRI